MIIIDNVVEILSKQLPSPSLGIPLAPDIRSQCHTQCHTLTTPVATVSIVYCNTNCSREVAQEQSVS